MSKRKFILYCSRIFIGGGFNQLIEFLDKINFDRYESIIYLDYRLKNNEILQTHLNKFSKVKYIKNNIINFIIFDLIISYKYHKDDIIFCFANLPLIFNLNKNVYLFIQNTLYLNNDIYKKKYFIKFFLFKKIIQYKIKTYCKIFVQTNLMKSTFLNNFNYDSNNIKILFFYYKDTLEKVESQKIYPKYDFIYIADDAIHKNHKILIEVWKLLAKIKLYPTLILTVNKNSNLNIEIKKTNLKNKTKIYNYGHSDLNKIVSLLKESKCLIYPSLTESLGLPLIEANILNIPIIASDLNYVFEVCNPIETFNPFSAQSLYDVLIKYFDKKYNFIKLKKEYKYTEYKSLDKLIF